MTRSSAYFDYNATAPALPEVAEAVARVMIEGGNPSSVHGSGRRAHARVEEARRKVAALIGAAARDVIFTGGGTESNALGLKGLIATQKIERLIVSPTEHPSVLDLVKAVDVDVAFVPVDSDGLVERDAFCTLLESDQKTLVSIMLANNETGVIQPIRDFAKIAKGAGAFIHTDAVQAAGKIPVNFEDLGVDLLTLSAHKLAGPQGVGALVLKSGLALAPLTHGGGQELGRRSGTENVAGIVGFGMAADIALGKIRKNISSKDLRDGLEAALLAAAPEAVIIGAGAPRLPNTILIGLPGVPADAQIIQMDLAGFAVSSGSACSSGKVSRSHVLDAMNVGDALAGSAMRISLGWGTDEEQISGFLDAWINMRNRLSQHPATKHAPGASNAPVEGEARVAS